MKFEKDKIFITGGTGSLGKALLEKFHESHIITVFSRDEMKQHYLRQQYPDVHFVIGDVRDYTALKSALSIWKNSYCGQRRLNTIIHAAALKHVPVGERQPEELIKTNVLGSMNVIRAGTELTSPPNIRLKVIGVSTDKAASPCTLYGYTKAIMEKMMMSQPAGVGYPDFCLVRYGNVLASRGSVVPLFQEQIARGGPVTLTDPEMTRFMIPLSKVVELIGRVMEGGINRDIYIPKLESINMLDLAGVMVEASGQDIDIKTIGSRPSEKIHEVLVSEDEAPYCCDQYDEFYTLTPFLQEVHIPGAVSSSAYVMSREELRDFLQENGIVS